MTKQVILTEKEYNALLDKPKIELLLELILREVHIKPVISDAYAIDQSDCRYYLQFFTNEYPTSVINKAVSKEVYDMFEGLMIKYENYRKNRNLQE